ncbi:MAG TPA: folate-binding protein [Rhodanobacteraceae bacterium]|nr:folate-binding protein [Rhodanobacteraceae bacterium]
MTFVPSAPLPAETVSLDGADALAFAQAQLSGDVRELDVGGWQWSAWLDPQGRVRALLQVARTAEQSLLLLLRGGRAQALADALQRYVLRAQVGITAHAPRALADATASPARRIAVDLDAGAAGIVLGCGDYSLRIGDAGGDTAQAWRLAAIRAGHPWLPEAALGTLLPPALSLERLGAVSFAKGCFPGQEIAARLHYRGGHKRHLCRVTGDEGCIPGAPVRAGDADAGMVLDAAPAANGTCEALVVLRDDSAIPALERFGA